MKRRSFLRKATLATAAGATSSCTTKLGDDRRSGPRQILITSAESRLAAVLADSLSTDHQVLLTGRLQRQYDHPFQQSNLGHEEPTGDLVRGIDAIVHVAEPQPEDDLHSQIDYQTRCTYNLLRAAAAANVRRAIYLSTLEVLTAYDPEFLVTERWRPRPTLTSPSLPKHLGEYTCREFARVGEMEVVVLRLGKVVPGSEMKQQPFDPMWVAEEDAAMAVRLALGADLKGSGSSLARWSVFHISSASPRARFDSGRAKNALGYEPRFNG